MRPSGGMRLAWAGLVGLALCACVPQQFAPTVTVTIIAHAATATMGEPTITVLPTSAPMPTGTLGPYPALLTSNPTLNSYPPGFTPPTPTPNNTFEPTRSPTPTNTPTSTPTASDTAVLVPPVQVLPPGSLPPLPSNLLFIGDRQLKRVHAATGQIETLAGPSAGLPSGEIWSYQVSADQRLAAIVRLAQNTTDIGTLTGPYEFSLLDLTTHAETLIYASPADAPTWSGLGLSPDGHWLAYSTPLTLTPRAIVTATYFAPIYIVPTDGSAPPREVARCQHYTDTEYNFGCDEFSRYFWTADSQALIWSDGLGVWWSDLKQPPRLVITHDYWSPDDQDINIFVPVALSPLDDYLLAFAGHYEGGGQLVINLATGAVLDPLGSLGFPFPAEQAAWLPDGRLFIPRSDLTAQIWNMAGDTPLLAETLPLPEATGFTIAGGPGALPDGQMAWVVASRDNADFQTRGVYRYIPGQPITKLNGLPPFVSDDAIEYADIEAVWAPNGAGLVRISAAQTATYFVPADGSVVYDVSATLGQVFFRFTWLN